MKKVFYFSFFLFLLCLFTPAVEAKQVVKTCQYPVFVNVGEDGTLSPPSNNAGEVISLEIYDDSSSKITESPAGSEDIHNWDREKHGFPAVTNKGECPDYIVRMNTTLWGGVDYYAVDEEDALDKATDAAGGNMQYNHVVLYKEQNHESQLGIYHCDYQLYTIIVDYINETLSVSADGNGTLGVYYSAGSNLKQTWFSPDRETDKCATTISCQGGLVGTSGVQYYVFLDELAAEQAGFDECANKTCSGDDCDNTDSDCTTYKKLLFCTDHNCETDDDSIEHYYYQISNGVDNADQVYAEVHALEDKVEAMCEGLMSRYTYESICLKSCLNFRQDIINLKKQYGIGISSPYSNTCNLSERLVAWIVRIISIVRYIIPALLIVLSVLDFIKAIASDKDDEIKKAGSRFAKRLIVSVILLILPILIEFVLGLFNIPVNDFCL